MEELSYYLHISLNKINNSVHVDTSRIKIGFTYTYNGEN